MNWLQSRPIYEKVAYVIAFAIISYWIIEIKDYPFRITTSPKWVPVKHKFDKSEYKKPYSEGEISSIVSERYPPTLDYEIRMNYDDPDDEWSTNLHNLSLQWDRSNLEDSLRNAVDRLPEISRALTRTEWEQGYYVKNTKRGKYYHSKINPFPFLVWLLSLGLFISALIPRNKGI